MTIFNIEGGIHAKGKIIKGGAITKDGGPNIPVESLSAEEQETIHQKKQDAENLAKTIRDATSNEEVTVEEKPGGTQPNNDWVGGKVKAVIPETPDGLKNVKTCDEFDWSSLSSTKK